MTRRQTRLTPAEGGKFARPVGEKVPPGPGDGDANNVEGCRVFLDKGRGLFVAVDLWTRGEVATARYFGDIGPAIVEARASDLWEGKRFDLRRLSTPSDAAITVGYSGVAGPAPEKLKVCSVPPVRIYYSTANRSVTSFVFTDAPAPLGARMSTDTGERHVLGNFGWACVGIDRPLDEEWVSKAEHH